MNLLLHDCCAPCGAYVIEQLRKDGYDVTVYFYNPNIFPEDEYKLRLDEMRKYCDENNVGLIEGKYDVESWKQATQGLEDAPEGGARCEKCFMHRLGETAQKAQEEGFEFIATTLTISPHKPVEMVNKIGIEMADFYGLKFIDTVWRKNEGYKKACALSAKHDFHRQDYCGCKFSIR